MTVATPPRAVVSVCVNCRAVGSDDRPGERLLSGLRAVAPAGDVAVRPVQCLSVCKRPCTVAFSSPGRYTYLFGDLEPADAADIRACLDTYLADEHGFLLWRERPERLRRGIVARVPPLGWDPADGAHPR